MNCMRQANSINILPELNDVEKKLNDELEKKFRGQKDGFVHVGPKKWFVPFKYRKYAHEYLNFEVRADDVWITGIPRSGTTLTQELVWHLCHSLDPEVKKNAGPYTVKWFESSIVLNEKTFEERFGSQPDHPDLPHFQRFKDTLMLLNNDTKRRIIKSHMPFELLPPDIFKKRCKVLYLCRYPKDTALSYYTLQSKTWHIDFNGDFETYWNYYRNGYTLFGPYFEHVNQGYEKRNEQNFLFLFYEDMRKDLSGYIRKIANFLERPLTNEEFKQLVNHLQFDNFKKYYPRDVKTKNGGRVEIVSKGVVGGWKDHFSEETNREADEWIKKNTEEIGIKYPDVD